MKSMTRIAATAKSLIHFIIGIVVGVVLAAAVWSGVAEQVSSAHGETAHTASSSHEDQGQGQASSQNQNQAADMDAVRRTPEFYTVLLENEHVRVLDYHSKPGEREAPHHHPPSVVYSLANFRFRNTTADGRTQQRENSPGDILWRPEIIHSAENNGTTPAHALVVELKYLAGSQ